MTATNGTSAFRPARLPATLASVELGLGVFFAITFCGFAVGDRFDVPYHDDWSLLQQLVTTGPSWSGLLTLHNGSLILTLRGLFIADYVTTGAPGFVTFTTALGGHLVGAWLFSRAILRSTGPTIAARRLLVGSVLALMFFTYQLQGFIMASAADHAMMMPSLLVAVTSTLIADDRSKAKRDGDPGWPWLAVALVASLAAVLTAVQGVAVPLVIVALLFALGLPARYGLIFLTLGLSATAAYAVTVEDSVVVQLLERAPVAAVYLLAFFGSFITAVSTSLGCAIGLIGLAAGMAFIVHIIVRRAPVVAAEYLAVCVLLFVGATAAMTTVGRTPFGPLQAAQSRYTIYSLQYWAALLVLVVFRVERALGDRARAIVYGAIVTATLAAVPVQFFLGTVWHEKAVSLEAAALALKVGVRDDDWVRTLSPSPALVYDVADKMRLEGRAAFLRFEGSGRPRTGQSGTVERCDGALGLTPLPSAPGTAEGFRIEGRLGPRSAGRLIMLDRDGIVQGIAAPAPLVAVPDPPDIDVVSAVRREMLHGDPTARTAWLGFTRSGSGPPYSAFLINRAGREICVATAQPAP